MRRFRAPIPSQTALRVSTLSVFVSLFVLLAPNGAAALQATPSPLPLYQVTDLGSIGEHSSSAFELNERGHATGIVEVDIEAAATPAVAAEDAELPVHAVLWRDGTITDLGTLGGPNGEASGLNDADQVAGDSDTADGETRAFLWEDGTMTDLGTLGGDQSAAVRINNAGQIVGMSTTAPGQELGDAGTHAFLWEKGTMTDLGTLGGEFSRANDINDSGQVVGGAETADGAIHPFLWEEGTMTDLGLVSGFNGARAIRITENGVICGFTQDPVATPVAGGGERHAFFYRDGAFTDLGTLGGPNSLGFGVNSAGQAVGQSDLDPASGAAQPQHGFLSEDGALVDLNDLLVPGSGWEIVNMRGITDSGQIAGAGVANGVQHAVLLTLQT